MTTRTSVARISKRGGSLILISGLFLGSAALRFGIQAAPAMARNMPEAPQMASATDHPMDESDGSVPDRAALQTMLEAFREREVRLADREKRVEDRAHAIEIAGQAVTKKLNDLVSAEKKLRETLSIADGAVEKDIARLTKVYETMKPKEAAALFEEMAPEFAAGFLARMRPEAAAEVMTGLSPDVAYMISVVMAGRNARAPVE
ncbi:MAG: MotE family protein [Ruegeria sp.]